MSRRLRRLLTVAFAATSLVATLLVAPLLVATGARAQGGPALSAPGATDARLIDIIQLDPADKNIGQPVQVACPSSGCQANLQLVVEGQPEPFLLSIQFVGLGAYVTLAPRAVGTAEVLQFGQGSKGAIFVPLRSPRRQVVRMEFIVVRSPSVRALERDNNGQVLASGNVFNRKRTPDLVLRLEFAPPGG